VEATRVPVAAPRVPLVADTLKPPTEWLELLLPTVKVKATSSPGASVVVVAPKVALTAAFAVVPWQLAHPVVDLPVCPAL
jgi:hypothetical protein